MLPPLLKLPPRKLKPWFIPRSFFLLMLLCISIYLSYGDTWNTHVMSGLVLLVATWDCWIATKKYVQDCWSFTCCLSWTNGYCPDVATLIPFYRYCFGRCWPELSQLVSLPYSQRRSTCYSDRFHDFSVTIPWCYKDVCQQFLSSHS